MTNAGPDTAAYTLTTELDPTVTLLRVPRACTVAGTTVTCTGTLRAGQRVRRSVVVRPTGAGVVTHVAAVSGAATTPGVPMGDPNPANDRVVTAVEVQEPRRGRR